LTASLEAHVTGFEIQGKGMFSNGTTFFIVESEGTLTGFEPGKKYRVERRFKHFKSLYQTLTEDERYKGYVIPPLPQESDGVSSYFVHSDAFI